jgi:cytochrome c551/c552
LQQLIWTGKVPMEMKTVTAKPDGFEIEFTLPVDKATAENIDSYVGRSYLYKYHPVYGSPTTDEQKLNIKGVKVSEDGLKVRLLVDNLRQYYLHEIALARSFRSKEHLPVLHDIAYYTLNNIPDGPKLPANEWSTKRAVPEKTTPVRKATSTSSNKRVSYTYAEIEPLLVKNTCTACHQVNKRQVGPAFSDIARRKYSNERIVALIYKPEPKNWPEHETPMAAMPQVPKDEAMKIATWINSLQEAKP